jgi:hypothetical protein
MTRLLPFISTAESVALQGIAAFVANETHFS